MLDYFYGASLIVTELLRDSVFNFYRYLSASEPGGQVLAHADAPPPPPLTPLKPAINPALL